MGWEPWRRLRLGDSGTAKCDARSGGKPFASEKWHVGSACNKLPRARCVVKTMWLSYHYSHTTSESSNSSVTSLWWLLPKLDPFCFLERDLPRPGHTLAVHDDNWYRAMLNLILIKSVSIYIHVVPLNHFVILIFHISAQSLSQSLSTVLLKRVRFSCKPIKHRGCIPEILMLCILLPYLSNFGLVICWLLVLVFYLFWFVICQFVLLQIPVC